MLQNNIAALIITFGLSLVWLRLNDFIAQRGWINSSLSRKIIHTGTGPLYVVCWLLFSETASARWLAALVPFAISIQFLLVGLGLIRDEAAVQAMSRSGSRAEILRGPLYYGIVFVVLTLVYWRNSPIGVVALMLLSGGDGLADIFGRSYGRHPLPWNPAKSWAGSLGMLVGGWLFSMLLLAIFIQAGQFGEPISAYGLPLGLICLAGALVESLPLPDIDNLTVTAVAVILGHLFGL